MQVSKGAGGIHTAKHSRIEQRQIGVEHINSQHVFKRNVIGEEGDSTVLPIDSCFQYGAVDDHPGGFAVNQQFGRRQRGIRVV